MPESTLSSRIESELEVQAYLQDLRYALDNGATLDFQIDRFVDQKRDEKYTNRYTVATLFPNENPVDALRRELKTITVAEYMKTVLAPGGKGRSAPERKGQFQPDEKGQTRLSLVCFTWKSSALQDRLPA